MKYLLVVIVLSSVVLWQCKTQQKRMTYVFPTIMKEEVKADFLRQCIKGEVLYEVNCAQCHSVKKGKQWTVPDFTTEQIFNYDMRLANIQHQDNLTVTKVTTEELGYILSFLSYKRKTNVVPRNLEKRAP